MIQGSAGGRRAQVAGNRSIGFGVTGYWLLYTPRSAAMAGSEDHTTYDFGTVSGTLVMSGASALNPLYKHPFCLYVPCH